jgi:predicted permease
MNSLFQDIRYGIRGLLKRPGFAVIAVSTLALGIGANTAIFSLVNTVLLRRLPVDHPEQIVSVSVRGKVDSANAFSYPNYVDFRDHSEALSGLLVYRFAPLSFSHDGNNERLWSYEVSGNYFDVLGVQAIKGRTFSPEEDQGKLAHPVVVLSHEAWQRSFAGDPNIVGREILLNNHAFKIVGVAPEAFKGTELVFTPELWVPLSMVEWVEPGSNWIDQRGSGNLFAVGRLKPGVNARQAEISLNVLAQQLAQQYPHENEGKTIRIVPTGFVIPELRGGVVSFSWALMGLVALVLLIACTNLAGLLLARGTDRRKEVAIRLALGASRFRLIRQLLTESVLLAVVGGAIGLGFAFWMVNLLLTFRPPMDFPLTVDLSLDWRVIVFSFGVSLAAGVFFGMAPALQATNPALVSALKDTVSPRGLSRTRLRSLLVVAQLSLSLVLLIGAALVVGSLKQLQTMSPGFDPRKAVTVSMDLGLQGYDQAKGRQFYRRLVDRIDALPGVRSAALTTLIPLSLNYSSNDIFVEGRPAERGTSDLSAMVASSGTNYFATMGTPLLAGREFTDQDTPDTEQVAIVNETFVRRCLPEARSVADAIGRRVSFKSVNGPFMRIVGVVKDGKYFNIAEESRAFIWDDLSQDYNSSASLIVRTAGDPESMLSALRNEVRALDPTLPLYDVKTMNEHLRLALFPARIAATVLGVFGVVALTLAAIGIYGVTSYSVSQRTREIGIRIALGAQKKDVLKLVVKNGMILTAIGVGIGLMGAALVARLITGLLFGVTPAYIGNFVFVSILLAAVALLACYLPARRATRVDPLVALRYE